MSNSYAEMQRQIKKESIGLTLGLSLTIGVICYVVGGMTIAVTAVICLVLTLALAFSYRGDAARSKYACRNTSGVDGVLWQLFQFERPEVCDSLTEFFAWRQQYHKRHGDTLAILEHVRKYGRLPGTELSLNDVPSGDVNHLHHQARIVAG